MRLAEIARVVGGTVDGDGTVEIAGVSSIEEPASGTITFLADPKYAARLAGLPVAAIILAPDAPGVPIPSLRIADPHGAFVTLVDHLHPPQRPRPGVHATAVVSTSATLGRDVSGGPPAVARDDGGGGDRAAP